MLRNTKFNPHTVTVRYNGVRAVANSGSRSLFCEYADRYTCAAGGVPMVYDLSVLGRERKKERRLLSLRDTLATKGVQFRSLVSYVNAVFGVSEVTLFWQICHRLLCRLKKRVTAFRPSLSRIS